jgi:hypothetical protein
MKRLLHTRAKIFFPEPYVVRVDYEVIPGGKDVDALHRALTRQTYKTMQCSWGHSTVHHEMTRNVDLLSLFNPDFTTRFCAYFCFKDDIDALQFRLKLTEKAIHVSMWPAQEFTIHEIIEDHEAD